MTSLPRQLATVGGMLFLARFGMISLGCCVVAAGCSTSADGDAVDSDGGTIDAGPPCNDTLAHYCADTVHACVLSWMPPVPAPGGCGGGGQACTADGHDVVVNGPDAAGHDWIYNATTGALIAVTNGGQCFAGPSNFSGVHCTFSSAGSCCPGDPVSTFTPSWKPPTAFNQGKCTDAQIGAFVDCLSGMPDAATCKTFGADPANKTCIQCAATPSTAAAYGPLIEGTVTIQVNVPGCIANRSGDISATGCGAKILALSQCEEAACETNCPVPSGDDGTAFNALLACQNKAGDPTTGSCKTFAADATCADALTADGGVASQCNLGGADFSANAIPMVKLFCGGILDDAGATDAGDGG